MEEVSGYLLNSSATHFMNLSNSSVPECRNFSWPPNHQGHPESTAFKIVVSVALAAVITFNGLIALVLIRSPSVSARVRAPLMNLLVAILISAVLLLCGIIISFPLAQIDTLLLLGLVLFVGSFPYSFVQIAGLLGLLQLSVIVFQMVACGTRRIRAIWLILSLVAIWVIAVLIASISFMIVNISRTVDQTLGRDAIIISLAVIIPLLVVLVIMLAILLLSICTIVATLCYIKCHTIPERAQYKKTMAKFVAFLIAMNGLNVLVVNMAVAVSGALSDVHILIYITYVMSILSYIPTPILIVIFLKPVRKGLHRLFCSKFQKNNETIPMQQGRMS